MNEFKRAYNQKFNNKEKIKKNLEKQKKIKAQKKLDNIKRNKKLKNFGKRLDEKIEDLNFDYFKELYNKIDFKNLKLEKNNFYEIISKKVEEEYIKSIKFINNNFFNKKKILIKN